MLWLLVSCLLTLSSGFPFHTSEDWDKLRNAAEYARSSHPVRFHSLFFKEVSFPPAFQFFMPLQTFDVGQQRCLSMPLMRAHVVKICSSREEICGERNFSKTLKEIIKEVETEAEKERPSDNTNIEVNGEEVEPGNFVKKENGVETKESKVEDKNVEDENKIIRLSEGNVQVSDESHCPEKTLPFKNFQDENMSISSNLV